MKILEDLISAVSPEKALRRARAQAALQEVRKFEAASSTKRTKNWRARDTGANTEIQESLVTLRSRSRQLHRDNAIARRITDVIVGNVVGEGVIMQFSNEIAEAKMTAFTDTTDIDLDGRLDFYGLQSLMMETFEQSGEVLIRTVYDKDFICGVKFQILEPDFVDHSKTETYSDGSYAVQGVVFSSSGLITGYWIYNEHPGDYNFYYGKGKVSQLRSSKEYKLIVDPRRAGQIRGYPRIAPVMINIREVGDTFNAELARRKIATCFAGFITDSNSDTGNGSDEDEDDDISKISPGTIAKLKPGQSITFGSPPPASDFPPFVASQFRMIAIGVGLTYESISSDLSGTNFSSARIGRIDFSPIIGRIQRNVLINQFCMHIGETFKTVAIIKGWARESDYITYTAPVRSQIDPITENNAQKSEIRNGFNSLSNAIRSRGHDPKKVLEELKSDLDLLDKLGLTLDSDPRKVSLAGNPNLLEDGNEKNY